MGFVCAGSGALTSNFGRENSRRSCCETNASSRWLLGRPLRPSWRRGGAFAVRQRKGSSWCASGGTNGGLSSSLSERRDEASSTSSSTQRKKIGGLIGIFWATLVALWAFVLFIPMLLVHPLVMAFDRSHRRMHDFISRWFLKVPMYLIFNPATVVDRQNLPPKDKAVVYVANHQSYLDIFAMGFLGLQHKFVSKVEIFRVPIVGTAMGFKSDVGLRRGDRRSQLQTFKDMKQCLLDGNSLAIFPEGTRSFTGKMRKFQSGAFKAARATHSCIVPLTIVGTREAMPPSVLLPIRRHRILVYVHPPIPSDDCTEDELAKKVRASIQSKLPPELQDDVEPDTAIAASAI